MRVCSTTCPTGKPGPYQHDIFQLELVEHQAGPRRTPSTTLAPSAESIRSAAFVVRFHSNIECGQEPSLDAVCELSVHELAQRLEKARLLLGLGVVDLGKCRGERSDVFTRPAVRICVKRAPISKTQTAFCFR
jgi:hypothetical protein